MTEAYAMVNLVEQGWASQEEVARGFGYSARTVRRDQRRIEDCGLAALGHLSGYLLIPHDAIAKSMSIGGLAAQFAVSCIVLPLARIFHTEHETSTVCGVQKEVPLTPSLSPSFESVPLQQDGERVSEGRVRGVLTMKCPG